MSRTIEFAFDEIRALPVFAGLLKSQVNSLLSQAEVCTHYHGESLFKTGEPAEFFGYVLSGVYKLAHHTVNGEEIIMYFGCKGEALAIMSVMEAETKFPFHALALGTARFLKIPRTTFLQTWLQNPKVLHRFQSELQRRIFRSYDEKCIQRLPLSQRIAHLLLYLSEFKSDCQRVIEIPLTRREIANYVGATPESVIRKMSSWSQRGWIATTEQQITLLNRWELEQLAYLPEEADMDSQRNSYSIMRTEPTLNSPSLLSLIWQDPG
jgi:CRP/FNR family transcriptional regulator